MDPIQGNPQATGGAGNTAPVSLADAIGIGQAQPKNEPSGNGGDKGAGTTPPAQDAHQNLPAWMSQLPDDIRSDAETVKQLSKFQKIGDLGKSYAALEAKLGRSVVIPAKDAPPEEVKAFYEKLGRPAEAAKYGIDDKNADAFKELAFRHNLTDEQAKGLWKSLNDLGNGEAQRMRADAAQRIKDVDAKLHQEYGSRYGEKMAMLQRGIRAFAGEAAGKKLSDSGLIYDEDIIRMFVNLGEMQAEAGTATKGAPGIRRYKPTSEGGSFSFKDI